MDDPTLQALLTVAGLAPVIAIITEALIRLAGPGFDTTRFGPILAIIIGIASALSATWALGLFLKADILTAVFVGIVSGGASMAVHDVITGPVAALAQKGKRWA
jgi:hypothetical protein